MGGTGGVGGGIHVADGAPATGASGQRVEQRRGGLEEREAGDVLLLLLLVETTMVVVVMVVVGFRLKPDD